MTGGVLLLTGVTALLPWIAEAVVARLGRGGVRQPAVRRLRPSSGTAAAVDPPAGPLTWSETKLSERFTTIRTGLLVGAACAPALIGASLRVSRLERLRERRMLPAALVALGTRRRTLSLPVLRRTAIPIAPGPAPARAVGLTPGAPAADDGHDGPRGLGGRAVDDRPRAGVALL